MAGLRRDLIFAVRALLKRPAFTAAVVATLALGIGPNTAIFSVVNGVLLRPLPYASPERLALMRIDLSGLEQHPGIAQAEVLDFRARAELLEDVGAVSREFTASLTAEGRMEAVLAANVTPNLFPMLGVSPSLGRSFTAEEELPDGPRVALISHGLWERRFGGAADVVGQDLEMNGTRFPIVGVMPEGFQLLLGPGTSLSPNIDLWLPMQLDPEFRDFWAFRAIARVDEGATIAQAEAEIQSIGARLVEEYPDEYANSDIRFYLHPLHNDLVQSARPAILTLLGAVTLVLLIACTNAAGLLVARMKAREKEIAVRAALGAGRGRIVREVLLESLVLALVAGAAGLGLGWLGLETLLAFQPGSLPRVDDIVLDRQVLLFTLGAASLAAFMFGMIPAWQASKADVQSALREGGRRGSGGVRVRTRNALVVAQVAFSVMLLIGAGLLIRTFNELRQVDLGFDPDHVITMRAPLNGGDLEPEERWGIYGQLLEDVRGLPGVTAAGGTSIIPLSNQGMMASYSTDGSLDTNWNGSSADYRWVFPGYFEAMGVDLVAGRVFDDGDNDELVGRVIVDESLAQQAWPNGDAVGQHFTIGMGSALDTALVEVVGVVSHSRILDVRREVRPQIYLPYRTGPGGNMWLTVKAEGDASRVVASVRRLAEAVGTGRPVHSVRSMGSYVEEAMGGTRFTLLLMGTLAGIALLLSGVGIYSVIAYLARQRTHDTGVRLALGAQREDIIRMNVKEGLGLAAFGVPLGLGGALALSRFLESQLFGVNATDPVTYVGIPLVLVALAVLASYVPASQASKVDPATALRDA
jgi:putative ABC transport system permease protein